MEMFESDKTEYANETEKDNQVVINRINIENEVKLEHKQA